MIIIIIITVIKSKDQIMCYCTLQMFLMFLNYVYSGQRTPDNVL